MNFPGAGKFTRVSATYAAASEMLVLTVITFWPVTEPPGLLADGK